MFHVALSRGQRPAFADLPPTLQPCAIAASAPRPDHVRAAALSGLIYLLLGGAALAFVSVAPSVVIRPIHTEPPPRVVEFDDPIQPPPFERVALTTGGSGANNSTSEMNAVLTPHADPDEVAPGAPTDRSLADPGAAGLHSTNALPSTGTAPVGAGTGPATIHDVSVASLAILHQVDPIYPEFARRARLQGVVVLRMTVDEHGQPIQVQVLEGHPAFHEAAMQAARQWRFEPARIDGHPVSAAFRLTLKFSLR